MACIPAGGQLPPPGPPPRAPAVPWAPRVGCQQEWPRGGPGGGGFPLEPYVPWSHWPPAPSTPYPLYAPGTQCQPPPGHCRLPWHPGSPSARDTGIPEGVASLGGIPGKGPGGARGRGASIPGQYGAEPGGVQVAPGPAPLPTDRYQGEFTRTPAPGGPASSRTLPCQPSGPPGSPGTSHRIGPGGVPGEGSGLGSGRPRGESSRDQCPPGPGLPGSGGGAAPGPCRHPQGTPPSPGTPLIP